MRRLALIALLAALGGGAAVDASSAGSTSATALKISYWSQGRDEGPATKWILRCGPAGGTLPLAASACRKLGAMASPFAPIPKDTVCSDQYGGPQVALITGNYRGRTIWVQLQNRNGCEISRFRKLAFLVPAFGAAGDS